MTQYRTYLDDSTQAGQETILSIQQNGSEFGVGVSTDIICNNISAGIVTAAAYVATGTTAVYVGINTSTVDSDTTAFHYITFGTNSSAVNISNFTNGKNFNIVARNSSGGSRTIIIRSSITTSEHTSLPQIVHSSGTITNGTVSIAAGAGLNIRVYNMSGTIIGTY